jgi:hypothetical protein
MRKRNKTTSPLPKINRPLSEAEAVAFREDLRAADQEVQSYFRVYYIIGLIGVAAWLASPEVKPLKDFVIGNGGYNIYVPIVIAFLNSVSTTYLLHKSIEIHEIAQFISYASEPKSGFLEWERWRRSENSATRWSRRMYAPFLTAVPLFASSILLYMCWRIVHAPAISSTTEALSQHQIEYMTRVFANAKIALYGVIGLHFIPLALIYVSLRRVPQLWKLISSRDPLPL